MWSIFYSYEKFDLLLKTRWSFNLALIFLMVKFLILELRLSSALLTSASSLFIEIVSQKLVFALASSCAVELPGNNACQMMGAFKFLLQKVSTGNFEMRDS